MLAVIKRHLVQIPFLLVLAIASLVSLGTQALAYAGVTGNGSNSLWSGIAGQFTLLGSSTATFTLTYGGSISPTMSTIAILTPVIFGAVLIIMLLMGVTLAITHNIKAVLIVAVAGIIGLLGVIILQSIVLNLFGVH